MILLFGTDDRYAITLQDALSSSFPVHRAGTWREVELASSASVCAVIAIDWLHDSPLFHQLIRLKARLPALPVVLVTRKDADNARQLKSVVLEEVLWRREAKWQVEGAVRELQMAIPLRRVVRELEAAPDLPAHLRSALVHACVSARPILSVGELASAVGRDRCTLSRQWRRALGAQASARLEDFLRWLLLLRAVELRTCGRKWAAVADEIGVHPHTLSRVAARLTGESLGGLAGAGSPERARARSWPGSGRRFSASWFREVQQSATKCRKVRLPVTSGERRIRQRSRRAVPGGFQMDPHLSHPMQWIPP